jgi:hypothetical protein
MFLLKTSPGMHTEPTLQPFKRCMKLVDTLNMLGGYGNAATF